jgi:hypothetical protein
VTPAQGELLTQIEVLVNAEIPKLHYPGFEASARPEGFRERDSQGREVTEIPTSDVPKYNRIQAAMNPDLPASDAGKVDASKFPGGVVPTKLPPKRLFGRIPTGRR